MAKRIPYGSVCDLSEAIVVFPYALIALAQLICVSYSHLIQGLKRSTQVAFICLLWGLSFKDKHQNPTGIANKLKKISHDRLQRLRKNKALTATVFMLELFQHALFLMTATPHCPTMLILDDVLIPKPFARCIQGAYWEHDHAQDRPCFGIRLVVLLWSNGSLSIPIAFLVWHKRQNPMPTFAPRRYRTKNQLARILVYWVHRKGLRFSVLTFDTWYASKENLRFFNRLGIVWVTALACNRKLRVPLFPPRKNPRGKPTTHEKLQCKQLAAHYPGHQDYSNYPALDVRARGFLVAFSTKLKNLKLVIIKDYIKSLAFAQEAALTTTKQRSKDPNKYLLTNRVDATVAWVIRCYQARWQIECMFRETKQHFALSACMARKFDAVTQHIAISFLSFVCLQQLRANLPAGVKDGLTLGGWRLKLQQWYRIRVGSDVYWVQLSEECESVDKVMENLLSSKEQTSPSDKRLTRYEDDKTLLYLDLPLAA